MTRVLITDHDFLDLSIEQGIFDAAGIALTAGQIRTKDEAIAGARTPAARGGAAAAIG